MERTQIQDPGIPHTWEREHRDMALPPKEMLLLSQPSELALGNLGLNERPVTWDFGFENLFSIQYGNPFCTLLEAEGWLNDKVDINNIFGFPKTNG